MKMRMRIRMRMKMRRMGVGTDLTYFCFDDDLFQIQSVTLVVVVLIEESQF
jgi:hypothetical protein